MYCECQEQFSVLRNTFRGSTGSSEPRTALSEVLPVGTVFLADAANGLIPRDHPRNEQGKYQARRQHSDGSFSDVAPVQPKGKIDFEREHAQQRNRRISESESESGKHLGETASQISP